MAQSVDEPNDDKDRILTGRYCNVAVYDSAGNVYRRTLTEASRTQTINFASRRTITRLSFSGNWCHCRCNFWRGGLLGGLLGLVASLLYVVVGFVDCYLVGILRCVLTLVL